MAVTRLHNVDLQTSELLVSGKEKRRGLLAEVPRRTVWINYRFVRVAGMKVWLLDAGRKGEVFLGSINNGKRSRQKYVVSEGLIANIFNKYA